MQPQCCFFGRKPRTATITLRFTAKNRADQQSRTPTSALITRVELGHGESKRGLDAKKWNAEVTEASAGVIQINLTAATDTTPGFITGTIELIFNPSQSVRVRFSGHLD